MTDASFTSQPVKTWAKRNARLYAGKKIWSEIRTRFVGEFSTKRMEKQAYFSLLILFTSPPSCVKNGVRKIPANRPPVVLRPAAGCGKQAKPTNLKRNNMTKLISKIITLSAFAGLVAGLSGCRLVGSGPQESVSTQPRIKSPPEPDWPLVKAAAQPAVATPPLNGGHMQNWFDCIRTRSKPIADVETGHRSATVCLLGNIARWTGRRLRWDPVKEVFLGDPEANQYLDRVRRKPYELPGKV